MSNRKLYVCFAALLCIAIGRVSSHDNNSEPVLNFSYTDEEYKLPEITHNSSRLLSSYGSTYHGRRRLQNVQAPENKPAEVKPEPAKAPEAKPEPIKAPEAKPAEVKPEPPKDIETLPDIDAIIAENNKILKEIEEISKQIEEVTKKVDLKEAAPVAAPAEKKARRLQHDAAQKKEEPVAQKPAAAPEQIPISPQPAAAEKPVEKEAPKKLSQDQLISYIDQLIAHLPHPAPSA